MSKKSALKLSIIALAICFLCFLSLRHSKALANSDGDSKDKKPPAASASPHEKAKNDAKASATILHREDSTGCERRHLRWLACAEEKRKKSGVERA